jgi:mRNA-degrading endonuclease toxin of MazEF toxin-antitoxin module
MDSLAACARRACHFDRREKSCFQTRSNQKISRFAQNGLSTQVLSGIEEGLKHESSVHCDEWVSLPKTMLTNYVALSPKKIGMLVHALRIALDIPK